MGCEEHLCMHGKDLNEECEECMLITEKCRNAYYKGEDPKEVCESIKKTDAYKEIEGMIVGKFGGMKTDNDKLRWDLLPFDVIEEIVDIMTYGAKKYEPNNWKKVEMWRYKAALLRHIVAWWLGEDLDKESGRHHLSHALCNLVFIRWKTKQGEKS